MENVTSDPTGDYYTGDPIAAPEEDGESLAVIMTHLRYLSRAVSRIESNTIRLNNRDFGYEGRLSDLEGRWKGIKYAMYAAVAVGGGGGVAALASFLGG